MAEQSNKSVLERGGCLVLLVLLLGAVVGMAVVVSQSSGSGQNCAPTCSSSVGGYSGGGVSGGTGGDGDSGGGDSDGGGSSGSSGGDGG